MSSPQPQGRHFKRILDLVEACTIGVDQAFLMTNSTAAPNARAELVRSVLVQFWEYKYKNSCDIVTAVTRMLLHNTSETERKEADPPVKEVQNEIRELFERSRLPPHPLQQPTVNFHINSINADQVVMNQTVTKDKDDQ